MFCVGIFGQDEKMRKKIRDTLIQVAFSHDMEIDTLWFDMDVSQEKLESYALKIQVALISADSECGRKTAKIVYQANPDCLICYVACSSRRADISLEARPMAFHLWEDANEEKIGFDDQVGEGKVVDGIADRTLKRKLHRLIVESKRLNGVFHTKGKRIQLSMPVRNILYFQSDLKYVVMYCVNGEEYRFFGKLSEVEKQLSEDDVKGAFLNIHKSYLVNAMYIGALDRNAKTIRLVTGLELPVSVARYVHVSEALSVAAK